MNKGDKVQVIGGTKDGPGMGYHHFSLNQVVTVLNEEAAYDGLTAKGVSPSGNPITQWLRRKDIVLLPSEPDIESEVWDE